MQSLFDEISEALWVATLVAGWPLGVAVVVGGVVAMLQAATQIQEQSLVFVPKLLAVVATLVVLTPWIGELLEELLRHAFLPRGS